MFPIISGLFYERQKEDDDMLDDFREWLSDNLRYFMLGGAILLVVLVLFFGIRACAGCGKEKKDDDTQQTTQQQEDQTGEEEPVEEEEVITNPLVKDDGEIAELITNYYKALGDKDVDTLKTLLTDLSPEDEAKITNATHIEGYEMGDVYTKAGMDEDSYVVYACYSYLCSNIETPVPAMSQVYVVKQDDKYLIDGSSLEDQNTEITEYMDTLLSDADVLELVSKVQKEYDAAQEADPALAEFLAGLGAEDTSKSSSAEAGTMLTVTEGCNVRAEASSDGEIIGGYDEGTEVEKLGEEGEWIKIDYEGQTGYIHSSLLE